MKQWNSRISHLILACLLVSCAGEVDEIDDLVTASRELSVVPAPACTDAQLKAIMHQTHKSPIDVSCSFDGARAYQVSGYRVIRRPLRFYGDAADGVLFDCRYNVSIGSVEETQDDRMITIETQLFPKSDGTLEKLSNGLYRRERPEDLTIRDCYVYGTLRTIGLGTNGQAKHVWQSATDTSAPGHVSRVRDAAPTRITFSRLIFMSQGRPMYLGPGTSKSTIVGSRLEGVGSGALYLGAESTENIIRNNVFKVAVNSEGKGREQISIDASDNNIIMNNMIYGVGVGGIYLYRNCGEGACVEEEGDICVKAGTEEESDPRDGLPMNKVGTPRITTPAGNQIVNNYFTLINTSNRSIWLGSREENNWERIENGKAGTSDHCPEDNFYDWGSGQHDWDFARYNVVQQNQFSGKDPAVTIHSSALEDVTPVSTPNYIARNETVNSRNSRKAGCFLPNRFAFDFIEHGQTALAVVVDGNGAEVCKDQICNDGVLEDRSAGTCSMSKHSFTCEANQNNAGCNSTVSCPSGKKVMALKAACNLETSSVSSTQVAQTAPGKLAVVRPSDTVTDGLCWVANTQVIDREDIIRGSGIQSPVAFGCKEKDTGGGDCEIRGELYCH